MRLTNVIPMAKGVLTSCAMDLPKISNECCLIFSSLNLEYIINISIIDNRVEEYRGKNRLSVCELSMSSECNHILYVKVNMVAKSVPIIVKIHA